MKKALIAAVLLLSPLILWAPARAAGTALPGVCIYNPSVPIQSGVRDYPACDSTRHIFVTSSSQNTTPFFIRSSSPITCTSILSGTGSIFEIINSGAAQSAHIAIYADQTCTASDLVFGDGTSVALGMGMVITLNLGSTSGFSYTSDAPVGANVIVTHS